MLSHEVYRVVICFVHSYTFQAKEGIMEAELHGTTEKFIGAAYRKKLEEDKLW